MKNTKIKIAFDLDTYLNIDDAEVWNNRDGEGRLLDFQLRGLQPLAVAFYRPQVGKEIILTFNKNGRYDARDFEDRDLDLYLKVDPEEVWEEGDIIRYDDVKVGKVFFEYGSATATTVRAKRLYAERAGMYLVDTEIEPRDWSRLATEEEEKFFNERWEDNARRQRVNGYIVTWEPNDIITMGERGERVIFQFLKDLGNGLVLAGVTHDEKNGTTPAGGEVSVTVDARRATHEEKEMLKNTGTEGRAGEADEALPFQSAPTAMFGQMILARAGRGCLWEVCQMAYVKSDMVHTIGGNAYRSWLPYEGNEDLMGTTNDR